MLAKVKNLIARGAGAGAGAGSLARPTRADVVTAFRELLGREPESERAIDFHRTHPTVADLFTTLAKSAEYTAKSKSSPFYHYHSRIDAVSIIRGHDNPERRAKPGHLVNFVGVAMNVRFMPIVANMAGTVGEVPIPANYHADMAEWAAALRAVDLAQGTFTMIELGCGWGCWMNITAVAAKRRGLQVHAIGVEGDPAHCEMAREALATNGIRPDEYTLHQGVAAEKPGVALFPKPDLEGKDWGYEPIFNAEPEAYASALASGRYDEVKIVPLAQVVGERPRIDLLHMDIQGGEADFVHDCLELLAERVAYVVIGTHSRQIEGRLFDLLHGAGWVLEVERPAIIDLGGKAPATLVDGVQGWRNPRLNPG